jgi:hypothetical protein
MYRSHPEIFMGWRTPAARLRELHHLDRDGGGALWRLLA